MRGPASWRSTTSANEISGISVRLLVTQGKIADRTVLTVRTMSGDCSFLPAEALDGEPIDIPDFGAFVTNEKNPMELAEYRRLNSRKSRIIAAVAKLPEQTLSGAYNHIRVQRVPLTFVGVDSNNQEFGIAPDGHVVVGNNDPSYGRPIVANFAVYCDSSEALTLFEDPAMKFDELFPAGEEHHQELEDGWLPIVKTSRAQPR
jgi:hypothetical protein